MKSLINKTLSLPSSTAILVESAAKRPGEHRRHAANSVAQLCSAVRIALQLILHDEVPRIHPFAAVGLHTIPALSDFPKGTGVVIIKHYRDATSVFSRCNHLNKQWQAAAGKQWSIP
jgi:hypothetical protein